MKKRIFMVITNDELELPLMQFSSAKECGEHFGISANAVRQKVCRGRLIEGHKIITISDPNWEYNKQAYQKRYSMTHDRTEYFKERYRRKKACGMYGKR